MVSQAVSPSPSGSVPLLAELLRPTATARLHHRFVQQAARTPDAVAVLQGGRQLSYRALDERSNRIAHVLRGHDIGPGDRVGVCLQRCPDLVAALLGVLKTGAAYVPLDPAYPRDRLQHMLADSAPRALIGMAGAPAFDGILVTLDDNPALVVAPATPLAEIGDDEPDTALACVFYTSGSTGRPKGVMLGHAATRFIDWAERRLGHEALARVAATTSICFDPSIFELFATLSLGGTVILKRDLLEPFAPDERPTLLNGVPSAFAELAREGRIPGSVRVINVGGERLSASLARVIHGSAGDGLQLWNHYGPTETTICASVALIAADIESDPPIGRPIAGAVFHVLDASGQPVAPGDAGELHIGGPNVALGYLNQPALTGERFLPDPFLPGGRMYRTGDIVCATGDGDLLFVGREGRQIKLHGFRIELDEIEAVLMRLDGIEAAATLATFGPDGLADGITAVVTGAGDWTLGTLRRALRHDLPRHMLPGRLIVLAAMPLTPSGKLDRQALALLKPRAPDPLAAEDPWMPPLTEAILTVFRDVLRQPALGREDDFFDHGGDSLQALDALLRIETLLDEPMPGCLLAEQASASGLAGLVARRLATLSAPVDGARAIALQTNGNGAPLFCLADSAMRPLQALALAYRLRGDRPVWSLVPSAAESAYDHRGVFSACAPDQPVLLLAAGTTAPEAATLAGGLADAGREVVLILVTPAFPPDTRGGMQRLRDGLRRLAAIRIGARPAASAPSGVRTILVSAAGTASTVAAWRLPRGGIERIALPVDADPMRAPAVDLLADVLRARLPTATALFADHPQADDASSAVAPVPAGDRT